MKSRGGRLPCFVKTHNGGDPCLVKVWSFAGHAASSSSLNRIEVAEGKLQVVCVFPIGSDAFKKFDLNRIRMWVGFFSHWFFHERG